jgi:exosortase
MAPGSTETTARRNCDSPEIPKHHLFDPWISVFDVQLLGRRSSATRGCTDAVGNSRNQTSFRIALVRWMKSSRITFSIFPLLNYLVWVSMRSLLSPFDDENALRKVSPREGKTGWADNRFSERALAVTWFGALSLSALVLILYAPVLGSLVRQWWSDPNYGHGFFVPVIAAYVLWSDRDRWCTQPFRPDNFGVAIMLFAIGLRILGMLGAELFMARLSLVILISGIVLFLAGRQVLRLMAFPIAYLLFMIPLPAIVYYQLTLPLQLWASRLAANGLVVLGIHTVREGNLLYLPNCTLNVVDACSGIRSLLSLLAVAVAYGYFAERTAWKRMVLAIASVPVAIATNGVRLVATGALSYLFGPTVDSGAVHAALGLGFFALAFVSILLIHKLLGLHWRQQSSVQVGL